MKAIYFTAGLLFIISNSVFAQVLNPQLADETDDREVVSGFFSFDSKFSNINGNNVWFSGVTFGLMINQQMRIGLAGYSMESESMIEYRHPDDNNAAYQFNSEIEYFGLAFEYIVLPHAPVRLTTPILIAGGTATILQEVPLNQVTFSDNRGIEETYWATVEKSSLAVIEPGINLELVILPWMSLDLGASYRLVLGSELNSIPDTDTNLSGAAFHTGLRFYCF